jgi:sugar fermentation stimulation protein A
MILILLMKFDTHLIKTKFIKRYKRFFVDVMLNDEILTAHCPNSGSMMGLLNEGE